MINNNWDNVLKYEFEKEYFKNLIKFVREEYQKYTCCPSAQNVFASFKKTDYNNVKVVILGQDPYHGINEANGLAFSVYENIKMPPSLRNIFKELEDDLKIKRTNTDLSDWAEQGVFLLNTVLSVRLDTPLSHKNKGWEIFTDEVINKINYKETPVVFILWGALARSKKELIDKRHIVIESAHPSPLSSSRGFFGSKPFSKTNDALKKLGLTQIKW